ncbi:hypothetical protein BSNK01_27100 [Bacillaceae bacterium]
MTYQVNGLTDMHTILANERKVGGAIEAEKIRLRSGEEYAYPVITHIDASDTAFYSLGFISEDGKRMIVNVNDVSVIVQPCHKRICELKNGFCRELKTQEKVKYLRRLCEVNDGACTAPFVEEVRFIVNDIGLEAAKGVIDLNLLHRGRETAGEQDGKRKVIRIA